MGLNFSKRKADQGRSEAEHKRLGRLQTAKVFRSMSVLVPAKQSPVAWRLTPSVQGTPIKPVSSRTPSWEGARIRQAITSGDPDVSVKCADMMAFTQWCNARLLSVESAGTGK